MAKANGKEAIRLWFEFLKRAHANPKVTVNSKFYKAWGITADTKFDAWWKEKCQTLFPMHKVQIANRYLSNAEMVMVAVPTSLTPTDAGNQLRELLLDHYKSINHQPKKQQTFTLTAGAEIKVSALRAYLATWDAQAKLAGEFGTQRVSAKQLLAEVRRMYLAKVYRWRNTKRKVEGLPSALAGMLEYDAESGQVISRSDDVEAERAVRRYLKIANKLVAAAACGDFPGKDYYKV